MLTEDEILYEAQVFYLLAQLLSYPEENNLAAGDKAVASSIHEISGEATDRAIPLQAAGALASLYQEASPRQLSLMRSALSDESLLSLQRDYTALFIGALKMLAPPYASYYLDGEQLLAGPSKFQIEAIYKAYGFRYQPKRKQPADNLAGMCEFVFALLRRAALSASPEGKNASKQAARNFYKQYMRAWIPDFCCLIRKHAQTNFYFEMGTWLESILLEDCLLEDLPTCA